MSAEQPLKINSLVEFALALRPELQEYHLQHADLAKMRKTPIDFYNPDVHDLIKIDILLSIYFGDAVNYFFEYKMISPNWAMIYSTFDAEHYLNMICEFPVFCLDGTVLKNNIERSDN